MMSETKIIMCPRFLLSVLFLMLSCFFPGAASAKVLKLKSGISLDVVVLDKNQDGLTVKTDYGIIKTFPFEKIEHLDGAEVLPEPVTEQEPSPDRDSKKVQRLYDTLVPQKRLKRDVGKGVGTIINYHLQTEEILQKVERDFNQVMNQNEDTPSISELTSTFRRKLSAHTDKIKNSVPPADLLKYREIILKHLDMMDKAQEELSMMNREASNHYLYAAKLAYLEALQEMKSALIFSGAPNDLIADLDIVTNGIKRILTQGL